MKPNHSKLTETPVNYAPNTVNDKKPNWYVYHIESCGYKFGFAQIQRLSCGEFEVHGSQFKRLANAKRYVKKEYERFVKSLIV